MKNILKILFLNILFGISLFSAEYLVVSNHNMKNLTKSQIKAIFLKKITIIDDKKIVPVSLVARDALRIKFEKKILKMSFVRLKSYWAKQHYLGHRPPVSMKSQEGVKAFVKKVDGAIGYIDSKHLDDSLKVIYRWRD